MDTINKATQILEEGIALLPDEAKGDFKAAASNIFTYEAIKNAIKEIGESEEKTALLSAYAVQEANRIVTTLWRLQILPEEMEKSYRELPTLKEMADAYNVFTNARKEKMDKIMADHKIIAEEEKELDIFKGIVNGIPAEESEKRYNDYQKQQQAAMAGGR